MLDKGCYSPLIVPCPKCGSNFTGLLDNDGTRVCIECLTKFKNGKIVGKVVGTSIVFIYRSG